jgi:spore germination cell wall hydrolase CwlJ-like protein
MWRENRGGGVAGMQSVANVMLNRVAKHRSTPWKECTARLQVSSLTAPGDPELNLWAADEGDAQWEQALELAGRAAGGTLEDLTGGALDYYAPRRIRTDKTYCLPDGTVVPFPQGWNPAVVRFCCAIAGQLFFTE